MSLSNKSVLAYGPERAAEYDRKSELVRGNRAYQRACLSDTLQFLGEPVKIFIELGCGTGYFTEVFFELFPDCGGVAIDGSEAMLDLARGRLVSRKADITFRCDLLERIDWRSLPPSQIVFSSLAIHHLADSDKWTLFQHIYNHLQTGGIFILFDSFRPRDKASDALLEFLTAADVKRKLEASRGKSPAISTLVEKDREIKLAEGDQEASLEEHLSELRRIGFQSVATIFQEARLAGIIAFKQ